MNKILIVEDDKTICHFMARALNAAGYQTNIAETASEAMLIFLSDIPSLVLLDLGLPDADGMTLIPQMKQWHAEIPVVVVSARTQESEIVAALDNGADDYVTKPFGISELMARVRTALRHARSVKTSAAGNENTIYKLGDLTLDVGRHQVMIGEENVHLTAHEFKILELLFIYQGKVLTYSFIMKQIWGDYVTSDNRILRVNMANIRRKLKEDPAQPSYIQTELGVGYRLFEE